MNVKKSLTLFHKRNSDVLSTPKSPSVCGVNNLRRSNSLPIISYNNLYLDWKTKCTNKCSSTSFPKGQLRQIDYLNPMCLVCFSPLNVAFKNKSFEDVQAEVEALIEFKHVVLQTFPEIRSKIPMNSTVSSRRHISNSKQIQGKSKKTLDIPENLPINAVKVLEDALQSLTSYSRSYSNCCRREPKSGEGSGGLIQDSGFSTETSSKDCCSALAFPGGLQVVNNTTNQHVFGTDDELFNLLDVVFRKTSKQSDDLNTSSACIVNMFCSNTVNAKHVGRFVSNLTLKQNLLKINKERDNLLLKVAEMESELVKNQIIISKMAEKLKFFVSERRTLKDQLKKQNFALELNQHKCDSREIKGTPSKDAAKFQREMVSQLQFETHKISEDDKKCSNVISKTIIDESARSQLNIGEFESSHTRFNPTPGSNSSRHSQTHDSTAIAAILLETNSLELQRQLLTLAITNKVERITPKPFETEINQQRCLQTNSSKPSLCQVSNSPSYMYDNADKAITQPFVIENANTNYKNFEEVSVSGAVDRHCDKSMSLTDWENDKKVIKRLKPSKIPLYSSITLGSSNSEKTYNTSKDKKLHTIETKNSIDTTSSSLGVFKRRNKTKMPTAVVNAKTTLPDSIFLTPSLPRHKRTVPTGTILKLDSYEKCKKVSNNTSYEKSNLERYANSIIQNSCSVPPVTNFNRNAEQKDDISNLHLKETETEGESIEQSVQTNVQLLVGGINKNSYRTSILNSMNHIRIQDDEIGRVRNLRSTLLGWLKI